MKAHDTAGENCRPWSVEKKSRTRQEKRRIKKGCVSLAALAFPLKQTGRGTRIRTLDLRIKSPLLYQLSYTPDTSNLVRDVTVAARKGRHITPPPSSK